MTAPSVALINPLHDSVNVPIDTTIVLDFINGTTSTDYVFIDTAVVTVDGVVAFSGEAGTNGWVGSYVTTSTGYELTLVGPGTFVYGETVALHVDYQYGLASIEIDGILPVGPEGYQYQVETYSPEYEQWEPPSNYRGNFSLSTRPAATAFPAGCFIFNTDSWSINVTNGTTWRNLDGVLT